jgi:transposase
MYGQMKRLEVQLLRKAGHEQKEIGELTGVSERSVRRIECEPAVREFDDQQARKKQGVGRPSKIAAYVAQIAAWIAAEPDLQTGELLRRAREKGYDGGKSQFFEAVRKQRPKRVRPLVRFEGLPGEFTQHDFGQVDVRFLDGSLKRIHFFASRLKWSRWVQVTIVRDERVETVVRTLVDHFVAMGGVPLVAVFDRPKTIALKWKKDGTVTEWNSTFIQVMAELGVGVELCWPYRGQEKGAVENLVGWVKGSFFKQRRFLDAADLEQQLNEWLHEANENRDSRATGVPPRARMSEELARLRPVKIKPDELFLRFPVQVGPAGMVVHDGRSYSMWPDSIGLAGTLFLGRLRVRINAGRWKTEHDRIFEPGGRSVLPEHRTAMVAAVSGRRGRLYLKREQLLELGPAVLDYFTEIVHRRPRLWWHDVEEMHEALVAFGDRITLLAIERALEAGNFGGEYVTYYVGQIVNELPVAIQEVN